MNAILNSLSGKSGKANCLALGILLSALAVAVATADTKPAPPANAPTNAAEAAAKKAAEEKATNEKFQQWKATLPAEQQAWEGVLEANLGAFYLPLYKRDKVAGRETAWDYVKDDPKLPRVLLIGDSVSRGYTLAARKALAGKANVHRAPENCGPTANGLKKLDIWLGDGKWDVVHFNFGIHDRATKPADYEQRLETIVARLQKTGAKLIWASTTPVPPDTKDGPAVPAAIVERNAIASRVMESHGVALDDLFTFITPHLAEVQNPKDVHFKGEGYDLLGKQVAREILLATSAAAQDTVPSPIGRFLLVSSEGLYVVEPNGSSTWFYNPTPYKGQGWVKYDDLIYDGWPLPNGHFLYAAHRYVREIDRDKRTMWEYRVQGTTEVKTCVPLPDGNVAVLNSQEQAILELETGTGRVLHRIAVPAKGTDHTRYSLLRRAPNGNYLVALRDEKRFMEVTREGQVLHTWAVPSLPVVAERLADGSTLCSGQFGLKKFDAEGKETWSFVPADTALQFPLLITAGFVELADAGILAVNSDWHYKKEGDNRVQLFAVGLDKKITWTLPAATFKAWKHSEVEPTTKLIEHRCMMVHAMK